MNKKNNFFRSLFQRTSRKVHPLEENYTIQQNETPSQLIQKSINSINILNEKLYNLHFFKYILDEKLDIEKDRIKKNIENDDIDNIKSESLFCKYFFLEKIRHFERKILEILVELYNEYIKKHPSKNTKDDFIKFILDVSNFSDKNLKEFDQDQDEVIEHLYDTIIKTGEKFEYDITELDIGVICYYKYPDDKGFELIKYSYEFDENRKPKDQLMEEFYRRTGREGEWFGSDVFNYY